MGKDRHVHLDVLGVLTGDMFVAAMLDALPELRPQVVADAALVLPAGGVPRTRSEGTLPEPGADRTPRDFPALVARIDAAALSPATAGHATAILRLLAGAEAESRPVQINTGRPWATDAWTTLTAAVAAGSIAAQLDGVTWSISALPLGGGTTSTDAGIVPVPSPVVATLLRGFRWQDDGLAGERITPMGAAIVRYLVDPATRLPDGAALLGDGMGAGANELPGLPNVLRALVFDVDGNASGQSVVVLTFDIDDMTGEEIGVAADRLRAVAGVLDLSLGMRFGKKGRPLHEFRLLLQPEALPAVRERCFIETSTIGMRWRLETRSVLERWGEKVSVDSVSIRRKRAFRPGGETAKAESDDLAALENLKVRRQIKAESEAAPVGKAAQTQAT